jgi:hypothetical protein
VYRVDGDVDRPAVDENVRAILRAGADIAHARVGVWARRHISNGAISNGGIGVISNGPIAAAGAASRRRATVGSAMPAFKVQNVGARGHAESRSDQQKAAQAVPAPPPAERFGRESLGNRMAKGARIAGALHEMQLHDESFFSCVSFNGFAQADRFRLRRSRCK